MNNQNAWTERTSMLHVALGKDNGGNSIGLRMSASLPGSTAPSMSFSRFLDLRFNLAAGQVGVQIENGVNFSNSTMIATFNVDAVATAFNIESGAYAQANDLRIFGEAPAGSTAVNLASGATFGGQGYILINGAANNLTSGGVYQVGSESLFDSSGNFQFGARQTSGYTIGAGTSSVSFSPAFTSTSSFVCTFSYNGTGIGSASAISYQIVSPSQIIVSSQPYIGVNYVCTGN